MIVGKLNYFIVVSKLNCFYCCCCCCCRWFYSWKLKVMKKFKNLVRWTEKRDYFNRNVKIKKKNSTVITNNKLFLATCIFTNICSGKRTKTIVQVSIRWHIVWIIRTIKYSDHEEKWNELDRSRFHTIVKRMNTMKMESVSNRELIEWRSTTSKQELNSKTRKF